MVVLSPAAPTSSAPITQANNGAGGSGGNGGGYAGKVYLRFAKCTGGVSESELRSQADGSFLLVRQGCGNIVPRVIPAASVTVRGTVALYENMVFDEKMAGGAEQKQTYFYCSGENLSNPDYGKDNQTYSSSIHVYVSGDKVVMSYTYKAWDMNGRIYRDDAFTSDSSIVVDGTGNVFAASALSVAADGISRASIELTDTLLGSPNPVYWGEGTIYSDEIKPEGSGATAWGERNSVKMFCTKQ